MAGGSAPAFRLEGVGHTYPDAERPSLVDVSAVVPAGETVAVLGPSGSGKSTMLSLMGLLWDGGGSSGRLVYHDGSREHDLIDQPGRTPLSRANKAALRASAFGFVLQSSYMLPHFDCIENLAMPLALRGWPGADRLRWAAELMEADREENLGGSNGSADDEDDLREKLHEPPRQASFGQRQRFAVLRALVTDPSVVFADEPSSSLDPGRAARLFDRLKRWKRGELFRGIRERFDASPETSQVVRDWLCGTGGERPPRTLVLVCHNVATARDEADRFLLLTRDHTLEASFTRAQWNELAPRVEAVLRLKEGEAGRDER